MKSIIRFFLFLPMTAAISSCSYTFYPASCEYPTPRYLKKVSTIPDSVYETSGIVAKDGKFISFNDSGGEASLYFFSGNSEEVKKSRISDISNVDWESIAYDGENFYIGDVGNNFGRRDTLTIYKIPSGIVPGETQIDKAEPITFSYLEEASHTASGWYSNDCEAMFWYNDSLYLFSKDWVNLNTTVYVLPDQPGHYDLGPRVSYEVDALITGADVFIPGNEVVLVGYRKYVPILIRYSFESDPSLINCGGKAMKFPVRIGAQTEGVCFDDAGRIFVTSEKTFRKQALYRAY